MALLLMQRAQEKEQSYGEVTTLYECSIVLLHGNSFHRNLCSETLLFGLHITATAEKWADCRNTNGLMKHFQPAEACFYFRFEPF